MLEYIALAGVITTVAITMIIMGTKSGSKDTKAETIRQIQVMVAVNFFLVAAFYFMSVYYLQSFPQAFENYITLLAHGALFLSLLAVSISTINAMS
jgi:hypothetical protein